MEKQGYEALNRMAAAQERISMTIEKQKPGKASQIAMLLSSIATIIGIVMSIDIILKWFGGKT